jgi:hypothetical protein
MGERTKRRKTHIQKSSLHFYGAEGRRHDDDDGYIVVEEEGR